MKKTPSSKNDKKGLTAHELTQKHMKDENHVVTDEELRTVKVGVPKDTDADEHSDEVIPPSRLP